MGKRKFVYRNEPDSVKNELVLQFAPMCHKLAKRYYGYYPTLYDYDDWYQIAQMGLFKAINTYEEGKKAKFITYATIVVTRYILYEINKVGNQEYIKRETVSADIKPGMGYLDKNRNMSDAPPGEDVVLSAVAYKQKSNDNPYIAEEEEERVNQILINDIIVYVEEKSKLFSGIEKTIFRLRIKPVLMGEPIGYTQADVSHIVGKSQEYVSIMEKRVRTAIQLYMAGKGITVTDGHLESF